jgi:hypothetical protein
MSPESQPETARLFPTGLKEVEQGRATRKHLLVVRRASSTPPATV